MIKEKVTDYVFHTTFDSSITDITDKVLELRAGDWKNHLWTDSYGEPREPEDNVKIAYRSQLGIGSEIFDALEKYIKEYCNYIDNDDLINEIGNISEIRFNKYNSGAGMKPHIDHIRSLFVNNQGEDRSTNNVRPGIPILSIVGLLNDDFIGGEFLLCGNEIGLKKNSLLVFPSNFMYPHEIAPTKEGIRYSFVAWLW